MVSQIWTAQSLIDRQAIESLLANHSRGIDRADANLLGSVYHADATVDYGAFVGLAADFVAFLAQAQKTALPSEHRTSNISIRMAGEKAVSESYVIAYVEDAEMQRMVFGRYLDKFEKRNGDWRMTHRTYSLEGNCNKPNELVRADPEITNTHFVPQGGKGAADAGRTLLAYAEASFAQSGADLKGQIMSEGPDNSALDAALSKIEIHELAMAYCRAVDRADAKLLKSIFSDDATVISGIVNGPASQFAEQICDYVQENMDYCFHTSANEWIKVSGDNAVGEHYIIAHQQACGQDTMTGGRYADHYIRINGRWKIKSRTFVCDWVRSEPSTQQEGGFYEGLVRLGEWGKQDPVYALWNEV